MLLSTNPVAQRELIRKNRFRVKLGTLGGPNFEEHSKWLYDDE